LCQSTIESTKTPGKETKSSKLFALEDFEDILRFEHLQVWDRFDPRLKKLHTFIESYPSGPPNPSTPSISSIKKILGGIEGKEVVDAVTNYLIDLIKRGGFLLDKQINAVEQKHAHHGGYNENLLKRRLDYRRKTAGTWR
jgi:four helix bundle suffix protein